MSVFEAVTDLQVLFGSVRFAGVLESKTRQLLELGKRHGWRLAADSHQHIMLYFHLPSCLHDTTMLMSPRRNQSLSRSIDQCQIVVSRFGGHAFVHGVPSCGPFTRPKPFDSMVSSAPPPLTPVRVAQFSVKLLVYSQLTFAPSTLFYA